MESVTIMRREPLRRRLSRRVKAGRRGCGSRGGSLGYDPLGRLRQTVAGAATTQFLHDGDRLSGEYTTAGVVLRRHVHGPGVDEPIVWYEGAGTGDRRWLVADRQGSVIAANGSATTRYSYGPYGEPDAWTGSRFRYTGQIALPEVGLYHYKARVYDPVLGRFLQTDPVGYEDDLNLYAYVGNDPLNAVDPDGRQIAEKAENFLKGVFGNSVQRAEARGGRSTPDSTARAPVPENSLPSGTIQVGGTAQITLPGGLQAQGSIGVAVSTTPDAAIYATGAAGPTSDVDGSASVGVEFVGSNAPSVENLAGPGSAVSFTAGDGFEGITAFGGRSDDGTVISGGVALSMGVSREPTIGVAKTETAVTPLRSEKQRRSR